MYLEDFLPLARLNYLFALGGLVLMVITAVLYVDYLFKGSALYTRFLAPFTWQLSIITTVGSVALSLLYSEYFGFIPCSLCWLQRIAIYPQSLMSLVAYRAKEDVYFPLYGIWLSLFGLGVATYQYIYQMVPKEQYAAGFMPCLADGSADCAAKVIDEFGFVTFPLLSAITFLFLIVVYLNQRRMAK
jgi:disulfide bond formation protein DsbB